MSETSFKAGEVTHRLLRRAQIIPERVPVSKSTFNRWVSTGRFPPGTLTSPRVRVWLEEEVVQWLLTAAGKLRKNT